MKKFLKLVMELKSWICLSFTASILIYLTVEFALAWAEEGGRLAAAWASFAGARMRCTQMLQMFILCACISLLQYVFFSGRALKRLGYGLRMALFAALCFGLCLALDLFLIARVIPRRPRYLEIFLKPFLASALMGGAAWAVYGLGSKLFLSLGAQSLKEALASGVEPGGLGARLCVLDQAAGLVLDLSRTGNALLTLGAIGVAVVVYGVLVIALRAISRDDLSLMPKGDKIARLLRL